ncbi:MAG: hypothetical protein ACOC0Z_08110 [Halohasta sp.]
MTGRRATAFLVVALVSLVAVSRLGFYRVRLLASRLLTTLPDWAVPHHLSVLPPPPAEYVGVWDVPPAEARTRLHSAFGFREVIRAYFHSYERDGHLVHEVGSYVFRPAGITGRHQLHVRLFPTSEGRTELWCHWERNPNRSPIAHLERVGYDPTEGERRLRDLLADEPLSVPDETERPSVVDSYQP